MKNFQFLAFSALVAWTVSCKKDSDSVVPTTNSSSTVTGYWFGSAYGGQFNQSFLLKPNGTLKVYDFYNYPTSTDTTKSYNGTGTYVLSGNSIVIKTAFSNGQTFSATAKVDLTATPKTMTFDNSSTGYINDIYKKQ